MSSPSITLGALKAELRAELWPTGEAYNLRVAHDKMFVEALYDLQQKVDCFQINNTQVVPFCATKFQCGMTVFTAPRGRIWRVSTVDRLASATGEEGAANPIQWCSEIIYQQVDYCRLEKFLDKQLGCSCSSWSQIPPPYCTKTASPKFTRFPVPDNSAYADFPELPLGFIYPTPSTDVSCGRAKAGVWAQHSGRIYLAPWIQSTELILVEWDGIKRDWTDDDLLDDDTQLKKAIKLYIQSQCARDYDCDQQKTLLYRAEYEDVRSWLLWECDQETKLNDCEPRKSRWSEKTLEEQAPLVLPTTTSTTTNTLWKCSAGACVQGNGTMASLYDCRLTGCEEPPECPPVPESCPEGWVKAYDGNDCLICCDVSAFDPAKVEYLRSLWELLLCRPPSCAGLYYWASFWSNNPTVPEEVIQQIWQLSDEYLSALVQGKGCEPPPPTGRCCLNTGQCLDGLSEAQCENVGGSWSSGNTCVSDPCTTTTTSTSTTSTTTPPPPYSCVDNVCVHDPDGTIQVWQECLDLPCQTTTSTTTCGYNDWGNPPENTCVAPCQIFTKNGGGSGPPASCWTCCDLGANCNTGVIACIQEAYQSILCRPVECGALKYWYNRFSGMSGQAWAPASLCNTIYTTILAAAAPELALKIPCGACCYPDGSCAQIGEPYCRSAGGSFHPGKSCSEVDCGGTTTTTTTQPPQGSCCLANGNCIQTSQANCALAGGVWTQGQSCSPNPCVGACCYYDLDTEEWTCATGKTLAECDALAGDWSGPDSICPADPPVDCARSCTAEVDCPDTPPTDLTLAFSGLGYSFGPVPPNTAIVAAGGSASTSHVAYNSWYGANMPFTENGVPATPTHWDLFCFEGIWMVVIYVREGGVGSNAGFRLSRSITANANPCDPRGTYTNPTPYTDGALFDGSVFDYSSLSVVIS